MPMKPTERMRAAMTGGVPDRVPVMPQICHPHAIRALGLPFEQTLIDVLREPARMNRLTLDCARHYGVDGFRVFPLWTPMEIVEENGKAYQIDEGGRRIARVDFQGGGWVVPLKEKPLIRDDADLDRLDVPSHDALMRTPEYRTVASIVREAGEDFFVVGAASTFTVEFVTCQRGKETALMDLIESPGFAKRIIAKGTARAIEESKALCELGVDGLMIADVYGGLISPRQFQEFCLPYMVQFTEAIRPYGVPVYLHVCGNATGILEMMADTGVDCIEPLDPLGGVAVADAKQRVGDRVALMGGVNTLALAQGTVDEVAAECRRCLSEGAPGGGYILASGDMLPTETPEEKVRLMVEAARAYRY